MKLLLVFASVLIAVHAATDEELWLNFKKEHGKVYHRSLGEEQKRFGIFKTNLREIEEHNAKYEKGEESYYLGVTRFADMTDEEFQTMLTLSAANKPATKADYVFTGAGEKAVPEWRDWRFSNVVVGVKDQGDCGSCWAFAVAGALESAYAIKHKTKTALSEQMLMDCTYPYGNFGCQGGRLTTTFDFVKDNGIGTEKQFPYKGAVHPVCTYDSDKDSFLKASGYVAIKKGSESALKDAVGVHGPVAVAVNSDKFKLYSGGVFNQKFCSKSMNHGVLVVGYGKTDGLDYWLVKNSWGASWGERGYIKMIRNANNQCGIANDASYPIVD